MTIEEALKSNPKTTALLGEWFLSKMLESVKDENVPVDFAENVRAAGAPLSKIIPLIHMNPNNVFPFFDEQGVYILPTRGGATFSATVNAVSISGEYEKRVDAERQGFIRGIEELELIINEKNEYTEGE